MGDREEQERRLVAAAMLEDERYLEVMLGEVTQRRDAAAATGNRFADVWGTIAAAVAEALSRLEQLQADVDGSVMPAQSLGIVDDED